MINYSTYTFSVDLYADEAKALKLHEEITALIEAMALAERTEIVVNQLEPATFTADQLIDSDLTARSSFNNPNT